MLEEEREGYLLLEDEPEREAPSAIQPPVREELTRIEEEVDSPPKKKKKKKKKNEKKKSQAAQAALQAQSGEEAATPAGPTPA